MNDQTRNFFPIVYSLNSMQGINIFMIHTKFKNNRGLCQSFSSAYRHSIIYHFLIFYLKKENSNPSLWTSTIQPIKLNLKMQYCFFRVKSIVLRFNYFNDFIYNSKNKSNKQKKLISL